MICVFVCFSVIAFTAGAAAAAVFFAAFFLTAIVDSCSLGGNRAEHSIEERASVYRNAVFHALNRKIYPISLSSEASSSAIRRQG
jgi:hypothetical protein